MFCGRAQKTAPSVKRLACRSSDPRGRTQRSCILLSREDESDSCAVQAGTLADRRLAAALGTIRPHRLCNILSPDDTVLCPLRKHACQRRARPREEAVLAAQKMGSAFQRCVRPIRRFGTQARIDSTGHRKRGPEKTVCWRASVVWCVCVGEQPRDDVVRLVWKLLIRLTPLDRALCIRLPPVLRCQGGAGLRELLTRNNSKGDSGDTRMPRKSAPVTSDFRSDSVTIPLCRIPF